MSDIPTDPQNSANSTHLLSNAELSELYPKPKTYEQKLIDQKDRELRILSRQPRHLALSTASRLFILISIAVLLLSTAPVMILSNVLAGVSMTALFMIILMGVAKWQVDEISSAFYLKGLNARSFLTVHLFIFVPVMSIVLHQINTTFQGIYIAVSYAVLYLIHYIYIRGLLQYATKKQV